MSETPPPASAPDYNVPVKTKFTLAKLLAESDGTYSSFWPLLIVLFALLVLFFYDVYELRYRKLILTEELSQLVAKEKGNRAQQTFIKGLHQDLNAMAEQHPDVATILNEFFPPASSPAQPTPPPSK